MKLKTLENKLRSIETYENPKTDLKQYTTSSHIAAYILHTAQHAFDDIKNKSVADLGCGSGVLCIGAALLDANYCTGFDIDPSAIALSSKNAVDYNLSGRCDFIVYDVKNINESVWLKKFDTVIMNPPFGNKGADLTFIKIALKMAQKAVYFVNKTSFRNYIFLKAKKWGVHCKVIGEVRFNLDQPGKFDKKDSFDVQVDLVRFSIKPIVS